MDFRLPALGEGIDSATVVGVRVKPGDAVSRSPRLKSDWHQILATSLENNE